MKRYNCTSSDKRGAFGLCMEEHKEGAFVPFSEVEQLQVKVYGLLEERNSTGIAINNAIRSGILPDKHPLRSRLELLANHHEREMELAAQLSDATRQCGVMAELLREAIGEVPQTQSFPSRCDAALAGKLPDRQDTEWTDATTSPVAADYRELQEQHDQLQSRLKGALDLLQEAHEVMRRIIPPLPQDFANRSDLLDRIEVALAGKQQNKPVTITETIRTAPERIWLQVGDQSHYHSEPFPSNTSEVTWCADSVVACEVPYVRADLVGKQPDAWLPIETAPRDGRKALVYRPLAENSGDERIAVKRLTGGQSNNCWDKTVPPGATPCNPTDGACHVTHWMPLPDDPEPQGGEPCAIEPRSSSPA